MVARGVTTVLVVGGGVMGPGIALACALGGKRVRLMDVDAAALDRARRAIDEKWQFMAAMELVAAESRRQVEDIGFFVAADLDTAAPGVDICFEAVPDNLALKRELIARLNATLAPPAPIATNSGNLLVDDIVAEMSDRGRVLSAHWINPPHLMLPVEVSPGTHTDAPAVEATMRCLEEIGKRPVRLRRDIPGRIANRLHFAMLNEAIKLLEEDVASAESIDTVARYTFILRHALFGPLGAHDIYGRKGTSLMTFAYMQEATGNPTYAPTDLHCARAELEKAARQDASRWRSGDLPDRRTCDEQVVALMRFLAKNEGGGGK